MVRWWRWEDDDGFDDEDGRMMNVWIVKMGGRRICRWQKREDDVVVDGRWENNECADAENGKMINVWIVEMGK